MDVCHIAGVGSVAIRSRVHVVVYRYAFADLESRMNRYVVDIIDEASGEKVGTSYEALRGQRMEVLMTNLGLEDTHRYKLQVKGYNNVRCGWHFEPWAWIGG